MCCNARIQPSTWADPTTIKAEVSAALLEVADFVADQESNVERWKEKAERLLEHPMSDEARTFLRAVITAGTPTVHWGMSLDNAKQILKLAQLIYHRPEVRSIVPEVWSICIVIDVPTLIENGGTMVGYEASLKDLLYRHGFEGEVWIEQH